MIAGDSTSVVLVDDELVKLERRACSSTLLYIVTMGAGENRFTLAMDKVLHTCLDQIHSDYHKQIPTLLAAVIFTGHSKYFSLGLELTSYYEGGTPQRVFHRTYQRLLGRVLSLPLLTVAAINGHAIAGGMVLALACDYRVMNGAKGFMAMNEIKLPSSIPAGMLEVVRAKMRDPSMQRDCLLLGRQWTGKEMHQAGIIDHLTEDEPSVLPTAIDLAKRLAHPIKKAPFVGIIKQILYREPLRWLAEEESFDHFKFALNINKL